MRPNASQLAMRDPALAVVMGAIKGADFGALRSRSRRPAPRQTARFGDDYGFGDEYNFGFGAEPAAHPLAPPGAPHAAVKAHVTQHHVKRALMLDPNRGSAVKVQGYSFSLTTALVLNVASAFANVTLQPNAKIHPKRMVTNAPSAMFVLLSSVQVANVSVLIGGADDAFIYAGNSFSMVSEFPTLDTSTRATMSGNYTGFVPPGFANNFAFTFVLTFQGPAALAGNG